MKNLDMASLVWEGKSVPSLSAALCKSTDEITAIAEEIAFHIWRNSVHAAVGKAMKGDFKATQFLKDNCPNFPDIGIWMNP